MQEQELRSWPRLRLQKLMFAEYGGQRVSVHDLSLGGAFMAGTLDLPAGKTVSLKLWLGTREVIEVEAMVRRVVDNRGVGVEFVELSEEAQGRLQRFLNSNRRTGGRAHIR